MDEWIKKMWYIYTMEYYSGIKKNKILTFVITWMNLGDVMLSEIETGGKWALTLKVTTFKRMTFTIQHKLARTN